MIVICVIIMIAIPMNAMRLKKTEHVNMKAQLLCIKDAEEAHRSSYGTYTMDGTRLANWKDRTKKYHFRIRYADSSQFVVEATGGRNDGRHDDIWTIDQDGRLANVK